MSPSFYAAMRNIKHPQILFWLGVLGILFYAIGPIFLPDAPIRQPEVLPVYTLMVGLGHLLRVYNNGNNGSRD